MKLSYPRAGRVSSAGKKKILQTYGPPLTDILNEICEIFKLPASMITSPCRKYEVMCCKRIFCFVSCVLTDATLFQIGGIINNDHTTVLHHRHKVTCWKSTNDPKFSDEWFEYTKNSKIWAKYENERS